jgi:hypothetical protein
METTVNKIPKKQLIAAALGMKSKDREDLAEKLIESLHEPTQNRGGMSEPSSLEGGPAIEALRKIAKTIERQSDADSRPDIPAEKVLARLRKKYP